MRDIPHCLRETGRATGASAVTPSLAAAAIAAVAALLKNPANQGTWVPEPDERRHRFTRGDREHLADGEHFRRVVNQFDEIGSLGHGVETELTDLVGDSRRHDLAVRQVAQAKMRASDPGVVRVPRRSHYRSERG